MTDDNNTDAAPVARAEITGDLLDGFGIILATVRERYATHPELQIAVIDALAVTLSHNLINDPTLALYFYVSLGDAIRYRDSAEARQLATAASVPAAPREQAH